MICDWVDLSHVIVSCILAPSKTSCPPPVIIFLCRIKVYKCNWTSTWILSGQFQCIAIHVLDTLDDLLLHRHSYIQLLDTSLPPPHGAIRCNNFNIDLSIYVHFTFGNLNIRPQEMWVVRCCLRQLPYIQSMQHIATDWSHHSIFQEIDIPA